MLIKKRVVLIAALLAGLSAGAGLLYAQTQTPDEVLACDPAELLVTQLDLEFRLRDFDEQVEADPAAALEALYEVGAAYQELAFECGYIPENAGDLFVGADVARILNILATIPGDPLNGQLLYNDAAEAADGFPLGCQGCHSQVVSAPLTEGTWTRWDEIRRLDPRFEGYTFEQYIVESIILPWEYTVPDYPDFTMPNNFGDRLNYQNLADLIAFLEGQDQLLE